MHISLETMMESSIFTILILNEKFHHEFWLALSKGSIPVVLSLDVQLPFEGNFDKKAEFLLKIFSLCSAYIFKVS